MDIPEQYMLDTTVFAHLVDGFFRLEDLPSDGQFWSTPVQWAELNRVPDSDIRKKLTDKFKELIPGQKTIPAGFAFDIPGAGWDEGEWRQDGNLWHELKQELDAPMAAAKPNMPVNEGKRKRKKDSNSRDASITEAAWFNGFTLITSDARLKAAAEKHGIKVFSPRKGNPSNTE
jgi:hypothetical protein